MLNGLEYHKPSSATPDNPSVLGLLPKKLRLILRQHGIRETPSVLTVSTRSQRMSLLVKVPSTNSSYPRFVIKKSFRISTSRFGLGQVKDSNCTPLGLHRVATKVGGGCPVGSVFKSRQLTGLTWDGMPNASIVHRILWLEGLEPGYNKGGNVDTFERYIYIHGFGDELTLGRPQSHGCIHLSARDLMALFDRLSLGTLVWISNDPVNQLLPQRPMDF